MKRLIISLALCLALSFTIAACNGDEGGGDVVRPNQNEQTQTGGENTENTENDGDNSSSEQEGSENKGKPITPIQNGGAITTK